MVTIGCPFCSKQGILMVITGLAAFIIGAALNQPLLPIGGIILIIAAYIIPPSHDSDTCTTGTCSNTTSQPEREEDLNE